METKKAKVMIYMPPELHKRLKYAAVDDNRNVSDIVNDACEEYLNQSIRRNDKMMFRERMNRINSQYYDVSEEDRVNAYQAAYEALAKETPGYFEIYEDGVAKIDNEELAKKLNNRFLELYEEELSQ